MTESFLEIRIIVDGLVERKALEVANDLVSRIPVEMPALERHPHVRPGVFEFACVKDFGDLPEPLLIQRTLELVFEMALRWELTAIQRYADGSMELNGLATSVKSVAARHLLVSFRAGMRPRAAPGDEAGA